MDWKTVLNSEVVLFLRSISVYWIGLGTGVVVLNSQVVPISQVVTETGITVYKNETFGNNWAANTIYLQSGHIVVWCIWTRLVVMQFTYDPKVFNASQANQIKW